MNSMSIEFQAEMFNEAFVRTAGIAFLMPYHPTVDEVMEIKTILAEAVVNSIIHGYPDQPEGRIVLRMEVSDEKVVTIIVEDQGKGIEDIDLARQPMYTTRRDLERSGMGMTIMETFSDDFTIESTLHQGTRVTCIKKLGNHE